MPFDAARFKLNPIIFVINNGVYGVEQWLADSSVFHTDKPFYESYNAEWKTKQQDTRLVSLTKGQG